MIANWANKIRILSKDCDLITRFAPSPTGYLHMGHIGSAVLTHTIIKSLGGKILLRLEDHDKSRCRETYCDAIREDLDWLGLEFFTIYRQTNQEERYQWAQTKLKQKGLLYNCSCTRREIRSLTKQVGDELYYPGTCRQKKLPQMGNTVRMKLARDSIAFEDIRHGHLTQTPESQCGDLLIKDRQNQWTYQFAVCVDDLADGVNLVIRGDDLLRSTGRQIMLGKLLGNTNHTRFLHHPLIKDPEGKKLSKRFKSTGVKQLREQGVTPEEVIGKALFMMDLLPKDIPISLNELGELIDE